jgi:hypothetical protein
MAIVYPELPSYADIRNLDPQQLYQDLLAYTAELKFLLEQRDTQVNSQPSFNIYSVVTVTEIGRPRQGDVAFSIGESKFKGYTGTAWQDFN